MSISPAQCEIGWESHSPLDTLDHKWARFLREHPKALRDFYEIAVELLDAGETRLSAKFLVEIARYRQIVRKAAGDRWSINNSFTSRLARTLETTYPELAGRFETRELHAVGA